MVAVADVKRLRKVLAYGVRRLLYKWLSRRVVGQGSGQPNNICSHVSYPPWQ